MIYSHAKVSSLSSAAVAAVVFNCMRMLSFFSDLFLFLSPSFLALATHIISLSLGVPLDSNSLSGYSQCSMYAVNFTQLLADGIKKADPSWPTMPCTRGWEFDKEELPYSTISTEVRRQFYPFMNFRRRKKRVRVVPVEKIPYLVDFRKKEPS